MPTQTPPRHTRYASHAARALWAWGAIALSCHAAGGTGEYPLPWPITGEVLVYRSCGCGDACWVAEVRDARNRTVKARLRCDCEQLHASVAPGLKEAPQAKRCDAIYAQGDDAGQTDKTDKPTAMARALEQLLGRR